jgi:hypothetical protein
MTLTASLIIFYFYVRYVVLLQQLKEVIINDRRLTKGGLTFLRIANVIWFFGIVSCWGSYSFFLKWYYVIPIVVFSFLDPIMLIAPKMYFYLKNLHTNLINKYFGSVLFYISIVSLFNIYFFLNLISR